MRRMHSSASHLTLLLNVSPPALPTTGCVCCTPGKREATFPTRPLASPARRPPAGTPGAPKITASSADSTVASLTFAGVPTAVKYWVAAYKNGADDPVGAPREVVTPGQQVFDLAADLGGEPGRFTLTVVAEDANGVQSEASATTRRIVGLPGAPAWASDPAAAVGSATLAWTAPAYNALVDTQYLVQLYRGDDGTKFGGLVTLKPASGDGSEADPFTATLAVSAGSWIYELHTVGAHGVGGTGPKTDPIAQRECSWCRGWQPGGLGVASAKEGLGGVGKCVKTVLLPSPSPSPVRQTRDCARGGRPEPGHHHLPAPGLRHRPGRGHLPGPGQRCTLDTTWDTPNWHAQVPAPEKRAPGSVC